MGLDIRYEQYLDAKGQLLGRAKLVFEAKDRPNKT